VHQDCFVEVLGGKKSPYLIWMGGQPGRRHGTLGQGGGEGVGQKQI